MGKSSSVGMDMEISLNLPGECGIIKFHEAPISTGCFFFLTHCHVKLQEHSHTKELISGGSDGKNGLSLSETAPPQILSDLLPRGYTTFSRPQKNRLDPPHGYHPLSGSAGMSRDRSESLGEQRAISR